MSAAPSDVRATPSLSLGRGQRLMSMLLKSQKPFGLAKGRTDLSLQSEVDQPPQRPCFVVRFDGLGTFQDLNDEGSLVDATRVVLHTNWIPKMKLNERFTKVDKFIVRVYGESLCERSVPMSKATQACPRDIESSLTRPIRRKVILPSTKVLQAIAEMKNEGELSS